MYVVFLIMKAERKNCYNTFPSGSYDLHLETINGVDFTHREIDIIACILSGKTAKKVALFLSISHKTVENHIRNIMIKLGCRAQENIIDFIEKYNKFNLIKNHYSKLLVQFLFETELKKIAANPLSKKSINCLIVCGTENKEYMAFVSQFTHHLKISGIKPLVKSLKDYYIAPPEVINYIIYLHAAETLEQTDDFLNIIKLSKDHTAPIISIPFNKDGISTIPAELLSCHNASLIDQENYYQLLFECLRKISPEIIDKNVLEFNKQYEALSGHQPYYASSFNKNAPIPSLTISNKKFSRTIIGYTIIFLSLCFIIWYLYLPVDSIQKNQPSASLSNSFFNWMSRKDYLRHQDKIASSYLENLEEEEAKLGRLDTHLKKLNFIKLRKNFITTSNMLKNLKHDDNKKTEALVDFLNTKFPINQTNRINEKIHKLFYSIAAYNGKLNFIVKLLENKQVSFLDFKDCYGNTAPMLAAAGNKVETFEWLVRNDALFINHKNIEGNSALILAALNLPSDESLNDKEKHDSIMMIKKIIEHDPESIKSKGHKGCTPLLVAGAKGNVTAVHYLLSALAPKNEKGQIKILEQEKNVDGNNILLLAAYNGRKHVIEWLHKKSVSMRQKNKYNTSAFMQAASGGSIETMDLLYNINHNSKNPPVYDVLTEKNNFGQNALFLAAHDNRVNVFQWILEKFKKNYFDDNNVNVTNYIKNERNVDGDSLLHVLINGISGANRANETSLNTGLLNILLGYIDVNAHSNNDSKKAGDTPLMRAAYYGNLAIVKYLVEKCGANINEKTNQGKTATYFSAIGGHGQYIDVIEYLWQQQAINENKTLNEIKMQSSSSLFLSAAKHGQKSVMEWLIKNEPDLIESQTSNGENALSLAIKNFHIDVIEFIFNWDRKIAIRLAMEQKNNNSQNILEKLIQEEKSGITKHVSLFKYLEQKIGIQLVQSNKQATRHNDISYKWRSLEIGIDSLTTSAIQPWSPYYLNYDSIEESNLS